VAHPLSSLGIVHTVLSVPAVAAGLYSFARYKRLDPATQAGRIYLVSLALSVVTSFGLSSVAGINPGHVRGVLALLAAFGGAGVMRVPAFGRSAKYLSALGLSFSFFLLLVPGINESLTRLPPSHPLGANIESPVVRGALLAWATVFVVALFLQMWFIAANRRKAS